MPTIDHKKTIARVRKFLLKEYPNYESLSAYSTDIKGLNYDNIKVSSSRDASHIPDMYIKVMQAKTLVDCTKSAIDNCLDRPRKPYKTILTLRVLESYPVIEIQYKVGYEQTQFHRKQNEAFLRFADMFLLEQLKQDIAPSDALDLHIYPKIAV